MKFFEVILSLDLRGREIGKTAVQLAAADAFNASIEAEKMIDGRYGSEIFSHTVRVSPITTAEFYYCTAA